MAARIREEFVSHPAVIDQGADWQRIHIPTHADHFYDVHRWDFATTVAGTTDGSCQIMSVVEGTAVELVTANGKRQRFQFAETFVVPAAAGHYQLHNLGDTPAKVIMSFVKAGDIRIRICRNSY